MLSARRVAKLCRQARAVVCPGLVGLWVWIGLVGPAAGADGSQVPGEASSQTAGDVPGKATTTVASSVSEALPPGTQWNVVAKLADGWIAAGVGGHQAGDRIVVLIGTGEAARELALPVDAAQPIQWEPVPLVRNGRLVGVSWLEGSDPRALRVMAAACSVSRCGSATVVAGPAPGSQLALRGVVLGDGTWLLVWSRFDGEDDEVVWSRGGALQAWTEPLPVLADDNRVPDISPTLLALDRGALVAWSQYDGHDYRVKTAAFDGIDWSLGSATAPRGSVDPTLTSIDGRTLLLFSSVEAEAWHVWELDRRAEPLRTAQTGRSEQLRRPRLAGVGADGVTLAVGDDLQRPLTWEEVR